MNVHPCILHLLWRTIIDRLNCSCTRLSTGTIFFYFLFYLFINALILIVLQSETVVWFVIRNAAPKTGLGPWQIQLTSSKCHCSDGVTVCLAHCKRGVSVPWRAFRASLNFKHRGYRQFVSVIILYWTKDFDLVI